ncbi:MAG: transposase [Pseudomonadota bacterium]|nr:transposase [Pseudomonadota bacterium]
MHNSRRGTVALTATDLFDSLAKLIPPPRRHRHHYHGVLSANSLDYDKFWSYSLCTADFSKACSTE